MSRNNLTTCHLMWIGFGWAKSTHKPHVFKGAPHRLPNITISFSSRKAHAYNIWLGTTITLNALDNFREILCILYDKNKFKYIKLFR